MGDLTTPLPDSKLAEYLVLKYRPSWMDCQRMIHELQRRRAADAVAGVGEDQALAIGIPLKEPGNNGR